MWFILTIILCLILVLSTLTTIPLIVVVLLCFTVISKKSWVLLAALIAGLLTDLFLVRTVGATALFLVGFTALVLLYQRRFEIQTAVFVGIASFLGSFFYLWFFGYQMVFIQAFINSLLSVLFFRVMLNSLQRLNISTKRDPEINSG